MSISSLKAVDIGTQGEREAWLLTEVHSRARAENRLPNSADIWNPGAQGTPSLGVPEPSSANHGSGCPTAPHGPFHVEPRAGC